MKPIKLYLAGPMTGLPDSNYPAFNKAAAALRQAGYEVVNPAETTVTPEDSTPTWEQWMRIGICKLMLCDAVATLYGCENSKGATLELEVARKLDIPSDRWEDWVDANRLVRKLEDIFYLCANPDLPPEKWGSVQQTYNQVKSLRQHCDLQKETIHKLEAELREYTPKPMGATVEVPVTPLGKNDLQKGSVPGTPQTSSTLVAVMQWDPARGLWTQVSSNGTKEEVELWLKGFRVQFPEALFTVF